MGIPREDQPVTYPPVLSTLGRDHETSWRESTHTELNRIRNGLTDVDTFGDIPAARAFGRVYLAAQRTYEATLRGIQEDLVAAGEALAGAAAEMRRRDDDAGSAFAALNARWTDDGGFSSSRRHDEAAESEEVLDGGRELVRMEQDPGGGGDTPEGQGVGTGSAPTTPADTPSGQGMDTGG